MTAELEAIKRKYEQIPVIVEEERDRHLKKFRPAKSADSKALYEKRLSSFVDELLGELKFD